MAFFFFGDEIILKFHLNGRAQPRQVAWETWRFFIYQVRRKKHAGTLREVIVPLVFNPLLASW